ncbi:g8163 [Coccomyxa elongata]
MDVFQAVLKSGELSERVLSLTDDVIAVNASNYNAWEVRWRCVQVLPHIFMEKEADFLDQMLMNNPKNYQLWNYRRRFAFRRGADYAAEELAYVRKCLDQDGKNYHAWAHRVAVAEKFNLWEQELDDLSRLLELDVRNNSAWNHRFVAASHLAKEGNAEQVFQSEVLYTRALILKAPHNESSWNYLRGLCTALGLPHKMSLEPSVATLCLEVLQQKSSCSLAVEYLADIYAEQSRLLEALKQEDAAATAAALGIQCFKELEVTDPIRQKFWRLRQHELLSICSA